MFTSGNETKFIFRTLENSTKNRRRSTVINKTVLQVSLNYSIAYASAKR